MTLLAALSGCLSATAWHQDAERCEGGDDRTHPNGFWSVSCRDGTGGLVWVSWRL